MENSLKNRDWHQCGKLSFILENLELFPFPPLGLDFQKFSFLIRFYLTLPLL
jgi:hypothetical protein